MPINVSEALDVDTAEIITVERDTGSGFIDGLYVKGSTKKFKTLASVQPVTPQDLQTLPEGERNKDLRKFISKKPLITSSDKDGVLADTVIFKGQRFKIVALGDWNSFGHADAIGARD